MANYTDDMNQTATYWAPSGTPDAYGQLGFAAPVTLACRWQGKTDLVRDRDGRQVVSAAVVYPEYEINPQGWMAPGDLTANADPREVSSAYQVIAVGSSPDLDEDLTLWKVWL